MQRSFIDSANNPEGSFPLNNLPYAVCKPSKDDCAIVCIAIGDHVLNLSAVAIHVPQVFTGPLLTAAVAGEIFSTPSLNAFLKLGRPVWQEVRSHITDALSESPMNPVLKTMPESIRSIVLPLQSSVSFELPVAIGDYTDFYSSLAHARNVGTMFRGKDNALPANWKHMPIAYHGRASSVVVSGTPIPRPRAQVRKDGDEHPLDSACALLDFELEMATVIGGMENQLGTRVTVEEAGDRIFGFSLMNDWSARDIQKWEYVPLGPFTAKNFATTISPFVVPIDALLPFRTPLVEQIPSPLPYLQSPADVLGHCAFDVCLRVAIGTQMGEVPTVVCESNLKNLYWSVAQQIAHHTVAGCNLRSGDLLGSGTISGEDEKSYGSMLELSWKGSKTIYLDNCRHETTRKFLLDGDTVYMTAVGRGSNFTIGFGDCVGQIKPSVVKM